MTTGNLLKLNFIILFSHIDLIDGKDEMTLTSMILTKARNWPIDMLKGCFMIRVRDQSHLRWKTMRFRYVRYSCFCTVGKWNSMFAKFSGIKYWWTIFMTGQRRSFSERTYFWRNTTLDATVWGKIWNALILVDNNVFVLQVIQSINSPNLEASRLQVHFLQHVEFHVFGEDVFWRNTDF